MNRRFLVALAALVLPCLPGCGGTLEGEAEMGVVRVALRNPTQACVDAGDGTLRPPNQLDRAEFWFVNLSGSSFSSLVWDQAELAAQCLGSLPTVDTLTLLPDTYNGEIVLWSTSGVRLNGFTEATWPNDGTDIIHEIPVGAWTPVDVAFMASTAMGELTVDASWNGSDFER